MKTIPNVTIYKCDFCKINMQRKHAMQNHEYHCAKNPKNYSACVGCKFLEETTNEYYIDTYSETGKAIKTKAFHCTKLDIDLYPYKVIRKGLLKKYPETFEGMEAMPSKCEHQEYGECHVTNKEVEGIPF